MPADQYEHPRLAACYDALDPDRSDLDVYAAIAHEFKANTVLDLGSGTGTFALLLAAQRFNVIGVEPATASLNVAVAKPGADRVRWLNGTAADLPPLQVDLVTMTANVAQAIVDPADWIATLEGCYLALKTGGHLVFESRIPAVRAWEEWTRADTYYVTTVPGVGDVASWQEVTTIDGPLVTFRTYFEFKADGTQLTSDSTLRFRERDELAAELAAHGYLLDEVRDAPDRPGREYVFVAHKGAAEAVSR